MLDLSLKVLVVDDSQTMRDILVRMLKVYGIQSIDIARDGVEALQKLKNDKFDLVTLDWNMPNMTGLEVVKKVRSNKQLKNIAILMVTANAERAHVEEALKAGVNNYAVKPFSSSVLKKKIEKIVGTKSNNSKIDLSEIEKVSEKQRDLQDQAIDSISESSRGKEMFKFCPECGIKSLKGSKFCIECGTKLFI